MLVIDVPVEGDDPYDWNWQALLGVSAPVIVMGSGEVYDDGKD